MFNPNGRLASFRAHFVGAGTPWRKSLAPAGYAAGGLVFADSVAQQVLAGRAPDWWTPSFVIVEGEMDWLTWVQRQPECCEEGPAILGISCGSWTPSIAARIPSGSRVVIRTHHDGAGDTYAAKIGESLSRRCRVFRSKPGGTP